MMSQVAPIPTAPTQPFPELIKPIDVEPEVETAQEVEQVSN